MNEMTFEACQAADEAYIAHTYKRFPVCLVKGEGVFLYDTKGNEYLDFTSGIGVNALGHGHPGLLKVLTEQMHTLVHTSNLFYTRESAALAARLTSLSGMKKLFYCNSGTEANEGAIKAARNMRTKNTGAAVAGYLPWKTPFMEEPCFPCRPPARRSSISRNTGPGRKAFRIRRPMTKGPWKKTAPRMSWPSCWRQYREKAVCFLWRMIFYRRQPGFAGRGTSCFWWMRYKPAWAGPEAFFLINKGIFFRIL